MRKFSEAPGSFNESENPDDQLLAELLDKYLSSLDSEAPISLAALQEQYPHFGDHPDAMVVSPVCGGGIDPRVREISGDVFPPFAEGRFS